MSSVGVVVHEAGSALKTFRISATVGLQGQVLRMPILVDYPEYKPPVVEIEIQKRHNKARFSMELFSDNEEAIPILVETTLSNGEDVMQYYSVGAKTLGWGFVSELGKKYTCDSVWRISKMDKEAENKVEILFSISFKKIQLDKGMLAAEIFCYSDGEDTDSEWEEFVKPKEKVSGEGQKKVKNRQQVIEGIIAANKQKIAEDPNEASKIEEKCVFPDSKSESEGEGSDVCYSPKPKKSRRD